MANLRRFEGRRFSIGTAAAGTDIYWDPQTLTNGIIIEQPTNATAVTITKKGRTGQALDIQVTDSTVTVGGYPYMSGTALRVTGGRSFFNEPVVVVDTTGSGYGFGWESEISGIVNFRIGTYFGNGTQIIDGHAADNNAVGNGLYLWRNAPGASGHGENGIGTNLIFEVADSASRIANSEAGKISAFYTDATNGALVGEVDINACGGPAFRILSTGGVVIGGGLTLGGQLTWSAGLGAITHILGPSDQDLVIGPAGGRKLTLEGVVLTQTRDLSLYQTAAPGAPTAGAPTAGGAVEDGDHYYKVAFETAVGTAPNEYQDGDLTQLGTASGVATCGGGNNTVPLTAIPTGGVEVTGRILYRTKVGGSIYYFLARIGNNTATTYSDTTADAALGTKDCTNRDNTTSWFYAATQKAGLLGASSTAYGRAALDSLQEGYRHAAVGDSALTAVTGGHGDIGLGWHAGDNITSGSRNVIIGYDIDAQSATGDDQLSIGNLIMGETVDGTGTTLATGTVAIGKVPAGLGKFEVYDDSIARHTVSIDAEGVLGAGKNALRVYSNVAQVNSQLVDIVQDEGTSTAGVVHLQNDGTGDGLHIEQIGVLAATKYGLLVSTAAAQINAPLVRFFSDEETATVHVVEIENDGIGHALKIAQDGILAASNYGLYLYTNAIQANAELLYVHSDNVAATAGLAGFVNDGTGIGVLVNQVGVLAASKYALHVYSNAAQVNDDLCRIHSDEGTSTADVGHILNDGTGQALYVEQVGVQAASKNALRVYSNAAQLNAPLVFFWGADAANATAIQSIEQDGIGAGLDILTTGVQAAATYALSVGSAAVQVNSELVSVNQSNAASTAGAVLFTNAGTGDALSIQQTGVLANAHRALEIYSNAVQVNAELVFMHQDNAASTQHLALFVNDGSGCGLYVNQVGVLAGDQSGILCYSNAVQNSATSPLFRTWQDNAAATAMAAQVINDGTGTSLQVWANQEPGAGNNPLQAGVDAASTNTILDVLRIDRRTTGTAGNGIGAGIVLYSEDASGTIEEAGRIQASFPVAAHATQTGRVDITALGAAAGMGISVLNTGAVGIGTIAPGHRCDIQTTSADNVLRVKANISGSSYLYLDAGTDGYVGIVGQLLGNAGFWAFGNMGDIGLGSAVSIYTYNTGAWQNRLAVANDGKVGIGNVFPGQLLDLAYGHLRFTPVTAPTACSGVESATAGSVNAGTYLYRVTFVTGTGETELGTASAGVVVAGAAVSIDLSAIPLGPAGTGTTARKVYRTKAGGSVYYYNAAASALVADNTTTAINDGTADAALTLDATYRGNTTSARFYVGSTVAGLLDIYNTFIGQNAGYSNTTGYSNTFLGVNSGYSNTTGYYNTFLGGSSGFSNTTGYENTFLGRNSGYSNTTGASNTFLGVYSGYSNTTGYSNTFLGRVSGYYNTTGYENTFLGMQSGYYNETGIANAIFGYQAGFGDTASRSFSNAALFGYEAGKILQAGADGNICMGYKAGDNLTTADQCIVIGYDVDAPSATVAQQMSIGNALFGTGINGTGVTISTGNLGAFTAAPSARFHVYNALTTPNALYVEQVGVLAANQHALYVYSNAAQVTSEMVYVHQDNGASTMNLAVLTQDGTGSALYANQVGVLAASQHCLYAYSNAAQVNSELFYVHVDEGTSTAGAGAIVNDGTGIALLVNQTGVLAASKYGLHLYSNGAQVNSFLGLIQQNNVGSTAGCLQIDNNGTGEGIDIYQDGVSAASKYGLRVYSNAAQVNTPLMAIHQDNAASSQGCLLCTHDGTGTAVTITAGGASGTAFAITRTANDAGAIYGMTLTCDNVGGVEGGIDMSSFSAGEPLVQVPVDAGAIGAYYGRMAVYVAGVGIKYIALYEAA